MADLEERTAQGDQSAKDLLALGAGLFSEGCFTSFGDLEFQPTIPRRHVPNSA